MNTIPRWQYGVRFGDGSEAWRWNGRTSRLRAEAELVELSILYSDPFELVRRPVDERGRPIGSSVLPEDAASPP